MMFALIGKLALAGILVVGGGFLAFFFLKNNKNKVAKAEAFVDSAVDKTKTVVGDLKK